MVASGDVDRLASLEKTKPTAIRDNEKKKYGTVNARAAPAPAVPLSEWQHGDRHESERQNNDRQTSDRQGPGLESGSMSMSESGPGLGSGPGLESGSGSVLEPSGLGFDYVGSEIAGGGGGGGGGVSRTRHELARATAGIVHGLAGLQVGSE